MTVKAMWTRDKSSFHRKKPRWNGHTLFDFSGLNEASTIPISHFDSNNTQRSKDHAKLRPTIGILTVRANFEGMLSCSGVS